MSSFRDVPPFKSAHDVRQLRLCAACRCMGDRRLMLNIDSPAGTAQLQHGRCFVERAGAAAAIALPVMERAKLTLADTGPALMRQLLEIHDTEESK